MSSSFRLFRKLLNLRTIVYPLVSILVLLVGTGIFVQSSIGNRMLGYAAEGSSEQVCSCPGGECLAPALNVSETCECTGASQVVCKGSFIGATTRLTQA